MACRFVEHLSDQTQRIFLHVKLQVFVQLIFPVDVVVLFNSFESVALTVGDKAFLFRHNIAD